MPKKNTASICEELAAPVAESMGLKIWDVRFEKEGPNWFLRFFIDRDGGVDIDSCENFSRAVEQKLDELDPIDQSYCLEVSSPGIERELTRPWHFTDNIGNTIDVKLIRAKDGVKKLTGTLESFDGGNVVVKTQNGIVEVKKGEASRINLHYDFDF